jgi:hypothetical protein
VPASTPPLLWRFPTNDEAYPDSPESLGRRFSEPERRISYKSSTTTMGDTKAEVKPHTNLPFTDINFILY